MYYLSIDCSDLCAGLVGGLGVTPSGNIGEDGAIFESVSSFLMSEIDDVNYVFFAIIFNNFSFISLPRFNLSIRRTDDVF